MSGAPLSNPVHVQHEEVLAAVSSLYDDELKPFGRILRKRVAGIVASTRSKMLGIPAKFGDDAKMLNVDMEQLRGICEMSQQLQVQTEEGGDWSVLFVGRTASFVDVNDSNDTYPPELWVRLSEYFGGSNGKPSQVLPGGRFSCAQELFLRQLPFLAGLSLGRVCHVVQLAISQKKILGYMNGAVVPYSHSQSMMKERRAERQLPFGKAGSEVRKLPLATIQSTRVCLQSIFQETSVDRPLSDVMVPLSNIKRLFRSQYQLELSETVLGHTKLSELLQDECFADICTVKLVTGSGYTLLPTATALKNQTVSRCARVDDEIVGHTINHLNTMPRYVQIDRTNVKYPSSSPNSHDFFIRATSCEKTEPMHLPEPQMPPFPDFIRSYPNSVPKSIDRTGFVPSEVSTHVQRGILRAPPGLEHDRNSSPAPPRAGLPTLLGRRGPPQGCHPQGSLPMLLGKCGPQPSPDKPKVESNIRVGNELGKIPVQQFDQKHQVSTQQVAENQTVPDNFYREVVRQFVEIGVDLEGCDHTRDWHLCGKNLQLVHPRRQQDCDQNRQRQQLLLQEQYQKFTREEYKQRQIMGVVRHLVDSGVDFATACSIATITEIAEDAAAPTDKFKFGNDDAVLSGKSPASGYIGARQNYPELSLSDLVPI